MLLSVKNLDFSYEAGTEVLKNITLEAGRGTVTGIFGPNGSGKTTLLRCMNGGLKPRAGRVEIDGESVHGMHPRQIARLAAVIPQDNYPNINFTVRDMVMLGRYAHGGFWGGESDYDRNVVDRSLDRVESLGFSARPYNSLSGGERQRILIARALAQEAPVLLMDEPGTHLDISHQLELFYLIRELKDEGKTVIIICHDLFLAPMFLDRAVLMKEGVILASGRPEEVLEGRNISAVFGCAISIKRKDGVVSVEPPSRAK